MKFKAGDTVRRITRSCEDLWIGRVLKISNINSYDNLQFQEYPAHGFDPRFFELVTVSKIKLIKLYK